MAVAACIEVITDHSVFFPVKDDTALTYACVALATLAAAVGVAVTRGRSDSPTSGTGSEILESVYASLTAVQRSAASVTQAQVGQPIRTGTHGTPFALGSARLHSLLHLLLLKHSLRCC